LCFNLPKTNTCEQSFEASAQGYLFTFKKEPEGAMDSDTDNSLMDLDEAEENTQRTGENEQSDDESILSYTSYYSPSLTPVPSSKPAGAVSPKSSSSSIVVTAFSSSGDKEKPKKKTVMSAISRALKISEEEKKLGEKPQNGLLKFFSKGTEEDRAAYFRREDEKAAAVQSQAEAYRKHQDAKKKLRERELARERQQKRRKKLKNEGILSGARSPGGTKRKVGSHYHIKILI
jgi:hypothetical protein